MLLIFENWVISQNLLVKIVNSVHEDRRTGEFLVFDGGGVILGVSTMPTSPGTCCAAATLRICASRMTGSRNLGQGLVSSLPSYLKHAKHVRSIYRLLGHWVRVTCTSRPPRPVGPTAISSPRVQQDTLFPGDFALHDVYRFEWGFGAPRVSYPCAPSRDRVGLSGQPPASVQGGSAAARKSLALALFRSRWPIPLDRPGETVGITFLFNILKLALFLLGDFLANKKNFIWNKNVKLSF